MASLEDIIRGRRSIGKVKPDAVPKELVEKLLEAATWAPSHHRTEPWRFIVMMGEGRSALGRAYADIAAETWGEISAEEREQRQEKEAAKAFRAPVVIAAVCSPSELPQADEREELAAVHAAVQNLLLTAHANGLGAVWRTGAPSYHQRMKQAFGLAAREQLVGLLYIGYPDMPIPQAERAPVAEKTVWME
ncbi:nitroreductase family protein [Cohnella boryungensis]|uniref:Putative NAD(P)H nitroreductase n=1 Tax=Cohnella boryungensis TaxID=768479 RepID=A0ABV8S3A8_9BACL